MVGPYTACEQSTQRQLQIEDSLLRERRADYSVGL
jgi:hypothetical protein